ncbi:zinc-binding alcohol dehydrogenase [Haloarcula sp. S1CR25-12]|uniref:Zinc-binding alcohol dehydrogenase n=1 Tax=Haloarcula saliterrae TaxID=2950534 RepID=A0ABU2FF91_9EURY|nr:zinc-binding alcohol dehydrogenase [Haloarcula sp. S1CR25-12]MDS0260485.1 zinc-binding alcohol dehydrogenase [Haloarcula sp. S1CR25-12]
MTGRALYFTGGKSVAVREEPIGDPGPAQVRVRTERSGISPGTELLVYREEVPGELPTDETIEALDGTFSYPLKYGYAAVGRVTAVGSDVDDDWLDRRVFAFNPHESHFLADPETLVPTTLAPERALFIPNVEAAVNFVMDARPRIGARVAVFGQGPVGLLTTALLSEFPLATLVTVDPCGARRELSEALGADRSVAPDGLDAAIEDPDIAFELSGNPTALDDAIDATGYAGRVIVGSWYGTKDVQLDLGAAYHRSHIRVRSSQVSRIDPDHADRWDKDRRLDVVRSWLSDTDLSALCTHEFGIERAPEAYRLLDERPDDAVQVALTYE